MELDCKKTKSSASEKRNGLICLGSVADTARRFRSVIRNDCGSACSSPECIRDCDGQVSLFRVACCKSGGYFRGLCARTVNAKDSNIDGPRVGKWSLPIQGHCACRP